MNIKKYFKENKPFLIGMGLMTATGVADALLTSYNIEQYGNVELNPLIHTMIEYAGKDVSLWGPKAYAILNTICTREYLKHKGHWFKGEWLAYGGSIWWGIGTLANLMI